VCVFSWNTNIVTVTTQPGGSYTCPATAPSSAGPYKVDVFFLGDYTSTQPHLPSKATALVDVS
jgi:hypothetical protein